MKWQITFADRAKKQLLLLDIQMQKRIQQAINEKLLKNPYNHLESLDGNFKNYYKFRVGDYRLICEKDGEKFIIIVIKIKHRKEVYK